MHFGNENIEGQLTAASPKNWPSCTCPSTAGALTARGGVSSSSPRVGTGDATAAMLVVAVPVAPAVHAALAAASKAPRKKPRNSSKTHSSQR